jgi:putative FmdB family regulatory protein
LPTYGYECTLCKEQFEVFQRITDAPLAKHEGCGGELRRRLYPVGIVFKGPGFHVNDYANTRKNGALGKGAGSKSEEKHSAGEEPAESKEELITGKSAT